MVLKPNAVVDIAKPGPQLQNLTGMWNARVLDGFTPFVVQFKENGLPVNLTNLTAFIEGDIGEGHYDSATDDIVMTGTPKSVRYTDDGSGNTNMGIVVFRLPPQFFIQTGIFKGFIGLQSSTGIRSTSNDVWFKVLGNSYTMGISCKYFISDLDKALQNFKVKLDQHDQDYQTQLQQVIDDSRNSYETETKNAHDSLDALVSQIQANRDEQQNLSQHLAGTEQQIAIHDIVTKLQHDTDIKNISDAINKRLSAMKMAPTGVDDYNSLIEKYPNGTDGVFLTQDTKHIYTYLNGSWQDLGAYEAIQLDKNTIESLYDTKGKSLGAELITNGSFGTNSVEPAYPSTTSTQLSIQNYLNRNWLTIHSDSTDQWKGVKWNIDKQNGEIFKYPLTLSFDAQSAEDLVLGINFAYYDAQGNQLYVQSIDDNAVLKQWRFTHYEKSFMPDNRYTNCASIVLQIITNDNKPIQKIMLTSVSLHIDLDTKENRLIPNGDFANGSIVPAYPSTDSTQLSIENYLNRNWLTIHSDGTDQWKGVKWNIDKPNGEIFKYPLTLSFDAQSAEDLVLGINFAYYDAQGNQLYVQSIDDNAVLKQWRFTHYEKSFMPDNRYTNCASIVLQIITNDNKPIQKIMLTSVSLRVSFDTENQDQKNLQALEEKHHLPVMMLKGDLTGISGENYVKVTWFYTNKGSNLSGYGTVKWQGDSSQAYPKKAYRLKTQDKIKFLPSWEKHNKYNLKAYYTDGLISRDPVNANIGGAIWSDQKDLPKDLITEDNFGFIDGFPIVLYINDKFAGVYSLNLPRSDFGYTKFAIIGSQYNDVTQFKTDKPNVKLDGSDFESLNPDDQPTEDEKKAVDSLISFVANTSDDDFKKHLTEHIDLASAIDYFIFSNIVSNTDAWGKNQVILSWDGKIWYWHPYDLDVSYSAQYDGSLTPMPNSILGTPHRLFDRLNKLYQTEIRTRYTLIRSWLTPSYVLDKYKARINTIGLANFKAEHDKWNNPAKDTEDFKQLTDAVYHQFQLLDKNWLITAQVQPASGTTPANTEPAKQETGETSSKPTEPQAQPTEQKQ